MSVSLFPWKASIPHYCPQSLERHILLYHVGLIVCIVRNTEQIADSISQSLNYHTSLVSVEELNINQYVSRSWEIEVG